MDGLDARHASSTAATGVAEAARLRRHGRRLVRGGRGARPPRRAQAAAPRASPTTRSSSSASAARRRTRRACSTRTSSPSSTAASGTARPTSRWSTSRADAQGARPRARRAAARRSPLDVVRPDPARGPLRAQARDRPPRPQAPERDPRRGGPRQGHRLRDRPRRRLGDDRDGRDHGHRPVPLARAGAGPARSTRALGPLLDRRDPLRAADRPRAVRRRVAGLDRAQARLRGAGPAAAAVNPAVPPALDAVVHARAREGPGAALPDADEFIAALEAARDARRRRSLGSTRRRPSRRRRRGGRRAARRWWLWLLVAARARRDRASAPTCCSRRKQVDVPDVVGETLERRRPDRCRTAGFEVDIAARRQRRGARATSRRRRTPRPARRPTRARRSRCIVSGGPGTATVPPVVGHVAEPRPRRRCRSAGFKIDGRRRRTPTPSPKGQVIASSPPEGATADKGSTVTPDGLARARSRSAVPGRGRQDERRGAQR